MIGTAAIRDQTGIIGKDRIRLPVAAKMALLTAGATQGTAGSPMPVGGAWEGTICTSTTGIWSIRNPTKSWKLD